MDERSIVDVVESVCEKLALKVNSAGLTSLSPASRHIYTGWSALTLTDNGGLGYFYENRWDAEDVSQSMAVLGILEGARVFRESMTVFPGGVPPVLETERWAWLEAHEPTVSEFFDQLDRQLPTLLSDEVYVRILEYMQSHEPSLLAEAK